LNQRNFAKRNCGLASHNIRRKFKLQCDND
jgi:hypothetical protein